CTQLEPSPGEIRHELTGRSSKPDGHEQSPVKGFSASQVPVSRSRKKPANFEHRVAPPTSTSSYPPRHSTPPVASSHVGSALEGASQTTPHMPQFIGSLSTSPHADPLSELEAAPLSSLPVVASVVSASAVADPSSTTPVVDPSRVVSSSSAGDEPVEIA